MGISTKKRYEVFKKTNFRCAYCGKKFNLKPTYQTAFEVEGTKCVCEMYEGDRAIDHIIPKNKGGSNDISNLLPCCTLCNSQKGSKDLETFRNILTFRKYKIPKFSDEQLDYLASKINLNNLFPKKVKFYFEEMEETDE